MVVMARLPPWFYLAWSCVCLVPIRRRPKPGRTAASTPPRPICVGCSDLRAITAEITAMGEATYRDHLLPQQLAVGVSDAGGRMVHAARISVQAWPRRVLLVLDATDAYQHVRRSVVLERMAAVPGLEVQTRFWHARSACSPYQFVGADQRRLFDGVPGRVGDSEEGVPQGAGDSPGAYAVATLPELRAFDEALVAGDGWARGYLDDVEAFGAPEVVFRAAARYIVELQRATGVCISGVECYSAEYDLAGCPHRAAAEVAAGVPFRVGGVSVPMAAGGQVFHRGVTIMGAPVGEAGYEEAVYRAKAAGAVSRIDEVTRLLRFRSPATLHTLTYYCLQHQFDYRLRTCSGSDSIMPSAAEFDRALDRALAVYSPGDLFTDPMLARRRVLPVSRPGAHDRAGGFGIRSRVDLMPRAFAGCLVRACESFFDTDAGGGVVLPGSFPSLRVLFGGGAFGEGGGRFTLFIQSGLATATAHAARWAQMRGQLGPDIPDHGPLSLDAAMAGARLDDVALQDGDEPQASRLQRALTAQLEEHEARALDRDLRRLPPIQTLGGEQVPDPRLAAWTQGCSIGRAFLTAWPSGPYQPTCAEFPEMVSAFFGASSPLATRLGVGRRVFSASHGHLLLDQCGFALELAAEPAGRCVDTWRTCHDAFTAVMYADALRAGIAGRAEPHSLFSDLLPPPQPGSRRRRREGIVPDALLERPAAADEARGDGLHRTLHDCKAVHFGPTRYRQAWVLDDERRCVDRRAGDVHAGYERHARQLDAAHHSHIVDPAARPIFLRLTQEFPRVRGQVFGAFRECSADVHALLRETATAAAAREWRESGASSHDAARAAYISILRRRWGCTVALAGARLRLSRAYLAGGDRDDRDAAGAGGVAAGFDFGDAARMAAEFAPILGGAPAGQRRH